MKKLVILSKINTKYNRIINDIKKLNLDDVTFIYREDLNYNLISNFDVIIFEKLDSKFLKKINKNKIVSISINKHLKQNKLIDISIDPFFKIIKKKLHNPVRGVFRPIQLDLLNQLEFRHLLNVITFMEWDSKFWKKKICVIGPKKLTQNIIFRCNKFIKKNKIDMIQFLSECHDLETVNIAEKNNFSFKDIRITLEKKINKQNKKFLISKNISFRKATMKDFKIIKPIAKNSYLDSRYYFDTKFSAKKVKEFYAGWLEKAILGTFDTFCLLICYRNKPIGFCTIKIKLKEAFIGLFSISEKFQKKGLSQLLLSHVDSELSKLKIFRINVITQGRNYSALKAYQASGFKIARTELWYHKWMN